MAMNDEGRYLWEMRPDGVNCLVGQPDRWLAWTVDEGYLPG